MIFYFPFLLCHADELAWKIGMKIIAVLTEWAKGNFAWVICDLIDMRIYLPIFPSQILLSVLESNLLMVGHSLHANL